MEGDIGGRQRLSFAGRGGSLPKWGFGDSRLGLGCAGAQLGRGRRWGQFPSRCQLSVPIEEGLTSLFRKQYSTATTRPCKETEHQDRPTVCSAHSASHTYLEGTDAQLKQDLVCGGDTNGEGGKHHVVDTEQWDQQQCGLGEPPGRRRRT